VRRVFDSLSKKFQKVFRDLRGLGRISESNISESLREVRLALLDADVNFKVARDFIEKVKEKAIGMQVIQSIKPGEQVVKIIHDELVDLLGSTQRRARLLPQSVLHPDGGPARLRQDDLVRQAGALLAKQGRKVLLVAADVYRPAAMDQLETLASSWTCRCW
jgi:signal recognition particle subunit SRP54